jgi:2-phospho-L-lactate guanylyltransferase
MRTVAILPVKSFAKAKERLAAEIDPGARRSLAEAMLSDVLVALRRSRRVDHVLVVTGDRGAQQLAGSYEAGILEGDDCGHNRAAARGIRAAVRSGAERALLVPGDCPLLDPGELDRLLERRVRFPAALVVPDRHGSGTNGLVLSPAGALAPSFGPGSRARHLDEARAAGIFAEIAEMPSLALDVDTPDDLQALREQLERTHGGAALTRGLLRQLTRSGA